MAMSPGARQAAAMAGGWVLAAGVALVCIMYFSEIRGAARVVAGVGPSLPASTPMPEREDVTAGKGQRVVELPAGALGHYRADAEINGRTVRVLVDTGASIVALTYEDARSIGLSVRDGDFTHRVSTANGVARVAPVMIDRISIGDITVRNVQGAVMEQGKLGTTLLGMSFLGRLQRVDMRSGTLVLQE
jgi:aspartyl protease family protein